MDDVTVLEKLRQAARDARFSVSAATMLPFGTIDGYDVQQVVGTGGQARVFKAVQRSTGRSVAVKVLLSGQFASVTAKRRFERETRLLAKLCHPHVVPLIDQGQTAGGTQYFTMPYVEGVTLDKFLCLPSTKLDRSLSIISSVARAVQSCHDAGIVHRDLKPSNIIVDPHGHPRILDFGLARPLEESWTQLTKNGDDIGTLLWSSPEQLRGEQRSVGPATDIYSLGALLYQCLSGGEPPFHRENSLAETIRCILERNPKAPSDDIALNAVALKALGKRPAQRFATASEFADAIDACTRGNLKRPRIRKHGLWVIICATITMAAAGAIAGLNTLTSWATSPWSKSAMLPMVTMTNAVGMTFVRTPPMPGTAHPLWIATTETTRRQWALVMGNSLPKERMDDPVADVTVGQIATFCDRLSAGDHRKYRLPAVAEWNYVATAGTVSGPMSWLGSAATTWGAENADGHAHAVGSLRSNVWGLYDTLGNVSEICTDGQAFCACGGDFRTDLAKCSVLKPSSLWSVSSHMPTVGFRLVAGIRD